MWSKYHPFYQKLKGEFFDFFTSRLEASLLSFILGLLWGFCLFTHGVFFVGAVGTFVFFFIYKEYLKRSSLFLLLTFFFLGVGLVQGRLKMVAHPVLTEPLFQIQMEGDVRQNLILPDQQILILENIKGPRPFLSALTKVRLIFKQTQKILKRGDHISGQVSLFPIQPVNSLFQMKGPSLLYFEGIGATGQLLTLTHHKSFLRAPGLLEKIRQKVVQYVFQILPENQARIAVPLMIGEQRFVSQEQYRLYRQAGIVHVLSVSGFHMALLAGFLFFLIRGVCAFIPYLTLSFNAKKIAAVCAWVGTLFYLILSGHQIPAVRSFGMISLVFLGILIDRPAFSKRSLFLIAFALLFYAPENIFSISFQLSFLSVLVLITTHEKIHQKLKNQSRWLRHLVEFFCLNIFITLALMPVIAWHFNLINPYGFLGNLFLSFVFSLVVMPGLFLGCLLIPFSSEIFFVWTGHVLSWIEKLCSYIVHFPFAEIVVPTYHPVGLCCFILALVFYCTYKTFGKVIAFLLIGCGVVFMISTPSPNLVIYQNTYVWEKDHHLFQNTEAQAYVISRFQKRLGYDQTHPVALPEALILKGHKIALKGSGCVGAQLALLPYPDAGCHAPTLLLDSKQIYQIFVKSHQIKIQQGDKIIRTIKS